MFTIRKKWKTLQKLAMAAYQPPEKKLEDLQFNGCTMGQQQLYLHTHIHYTARINKHLKMEYECDIFTT